MTNDTTARSLLQLLMQHEMRLNAYYRECAHQLPEEDAFWQALAAAEVEHARALSTLLTLAEEGKFSIRENAIHRGTFEAFNQYVSEQIRMISRGGLSLSVLLSIALDIELTTLEQDSLSYYAGDTPELAQIRATLQEETRQHIAMIRAKLEAVSKR